LSLCRHNPPGLSGHHQFLLGVNDNTVHQARTNAGISYSEAPPSRSAGMDELLQVVRTAWRGKTCQIASQADQQLIAKRQD
jgi:hypothetical protein